MIKWTSVFLRALKLGKRSVALKTATVSNLLTYTRKIRPTLLGCKTF